MESAISQTYFLFVIKLFHSTQQIVFFVWLIVATIFCFLPFTILTTRGSVVACAEEGFQLDLFYFC